MTPEQAAKRCEALSAALVHDEDLDLAPLDDLARDVLESAKSWDSRGIALVKDRYDAVVKLASERHEAMHSKLSSMAVGGKAVRGYGRPNDRLYTGQRISRDV